MTTRPIAPHTASVRLSVAMIVRDCAEPLAATLDCVQNLADEIVIVDTGSRDKTREFASKRATRVVDFAWSDDFSAARNAALDYVNFCLEGWWGSQVALQGYYSPTTTCDAYLETSRNSSEEYTDYEWWYQGGSGPEAKEGWPITGRDTGAYDTRWGNIMHWMTWPDDPDYYATRWNDFLSA